MGLRRQLIHSPDKSAANRKAFQFHHILSQIFKSYAWREKLPDVLVLNKSIALNDENIHIDCSRSPSLSNNPKILNNYLLSDPGPIIIYPSQ